MTAAATVAATVTASTHSSGLNMQNCELWTVSHSRSMHAYLLAWRWRQQEHSFSFSFSNRFFFSSFICYPISKLLILFFALHPIQPESNTNIFYFPIEAYAFTYMHEHEHKLSKAKINFTLRSHFIYFLFFCLFHLKFSSI